MRIFAQDHMEEIWAGHEGLTISHFIDNGIKFYLATRVGHVCFRPAPLSHYNAHANTKFKGKIP